MDSFINGGQGDVKDFVTRNPEKSPFSARDAPLRSPVRGAAHPPIGAAPRFARNQEPAAGVPVQMTITCEVSPCWLV